MVDINLIPREYREKREGLRAVFSKTTIGVLALVILGLLFYGGLLLYKDNLNKDLESLDQEILALEQKRDSKTEQAMIDLDKRINILKTLFENHVYWSGLLEKIEELVIPETYFDGAEISILQDTITFNTTGATSTYTNLARQILTFQEEPLIQKVQVSAISLNEDMGIEFNISTIFSKDIIMQNHD